jgi:hypothetical protein
MPPTTATAVPGAYSLVVFGPVNTRVWRARETRFTTVAAIK